MNRERALKIVLVLVGLIFLFGVYPIDDVSVVERVAMAAEPAGITYPQSQPTDSWAGCASYC